MFLTEWTGEWSPASKTAAVVAQKVPPKVTYSLKDVLSNMESSHHIKPKASYISVAKIQITLSDDIFQNYFSSLKY